MNTFANNWMSGIADDTNISEISIPGTHESCARRSLGDSQCQWFGIIEQLNMGIRFLDIRCNYKTERESGQQKDVYFPVYHGAANQYLTFEEVQAQCVAFLEANPSEFILMNIQKNDNSDGTAFGNKFLELIKPYEKYWYMETGLTIRPGFGFVPGLPEISKIRNRIVLIRSYDFATKAGWYIPDSGDFKGGLEWAGFDQNRDSNNGVFYTQNRWEDVNGTDKGLMVEAMIQQTAENSAYGAITLNFLSHTDNKTPGKNAQDMNNRIRDYVKSFAGSLLGVITIDFTGNTGYRADSLENSVIARQKHQKPGWFYCTTS